MSSASTDASFVALVSINHFVRLFGEKRDELEEQQRHLNVGLDKLLETVNQVEELRQSLASKRVQLEAKDAEANAKLQQMVHDQQEAEQKKAASIEIQASLATQTSQIEERQGIVQGELADAEPAIIEAEGAVRNIRKQHLTEVRSMANPPEAVKMAMESVCTVLGHKLDGWKTVQSILRRDDFITSIINFDSVHLAKPLRERMEREYLSRPTFTFENVDRASKACGPLVKWVIAQLRYAAILEHTEPLRAEVASLQHELAQTKHQAASIMELIDGLERSIDGYKADYARLISETQAIKGEMERVALRVDRSVTLLGSLSAEQERWQAGSKTFEAEMGTIVGDVLLSAAFLAYGGYFDQAFREVLWHEWADHLEAAGIRAKAELAFPEFLSTADDRLGWQAKALPADALSFENAIMLRRFNRYPLVIDPTGQATAFLLNEYRDRRITVTSFLDEAFLKHLESALRFGTPILIQDVEHLDPILNAVLNREIRRTGGRVLIRLGNQDIDFSPAFTMFLTTRNPAVEFAPDICSRVTFVNFTMTRASLQSQALDKVLRVERPETETKRRDLVRLQGEFALRLRQLERSLLQALNDSEGNILDNDSVIDTLETLKREAGEVAAKAAQTDVVMTEVEAVTAEYLPLARACSQVYFVLDQLGQVNRFYAFSLAGFLDIFEGVLLRNSNLTGLTDSAARLVVLRRDLFVAVYRRTASALLVGDRLVLALLLAQLALRGTHEGLADELDLLLDTASTTAALKPSAVPQHPLLNGESAEQLRLFAQTPTFGAVEAHMAAHPNDWAAILDAAEPEAQLPTDLWASEDGTSHFG
jgi:dynein heavy chain 1